MVVEQQLLPFFEWLIHPGDGSIGALWHCLAVFVAVSLLALFVGYLIAMFRHGPLKAGDLTYRVVADGFAELLRISPRRVGALARLAIKESLRRRVVVALIVFVLILMFASWFLKTDYPEPGKLYLSFVLTATTYLMLALAMLLSAFSLPAEFKSKTIYTIVTKPVRAGDIVLGRVLGFSVIGTVLLLIMGVFSYLFVVRSLDHAHQLDGSWEDLEVIRTADGEIVGRQGRTTFDDFHRHEVQLDNVDGVGLALSEHSHEHNVDRDTESDAVVVGGPSDVMRARVPKYGELDFKDRNGVDKQRGVSVGSEWTYRSFVEGGTAAAAIWTFSDIDESVAADGLPIELYVSVFRTHKGVIERGILGKIQLRNPDNDLRSDIRTFRAKDQSIDNQLFARQLTDTEQNPIDLLDDLVSEDKKIEVVVQCVEPGQYFGFARADCYLRQPEASPLANFVKAYAGIWIQMVLVIAIGVACSTFLSGPVAMMFAITFIVLGFFRNFFVDVATGAQVGGGPIESLVRIVTQKNQTIPLGENIGVTIMYTIDQGLRFMMYALAQLLPNFRQFSTVGYVANGFNVPTNQLAQDLSLCLAYVVGLLIVGYFFLRTREVAR